MSAWGISQVRTWEMSRSAVYFLASGAIPLPPNWRSPFKVRQYGRPVACRRKLPLYLYTFPYSGAMLKSTLPLRGSPPCLCVYSQRRFRSPSSYCRTGRRSISSNTVLYTDPWFPEPFTVAVVVVSFLRRSNQKNAWFSNLRGTGYSRIPRTLLK